MIFHLIVGLTKKYYYIKMGYFPPYSHSKNKIEVELHLPNHATKSDFWYMWYEKVLIHCNLSVDILQFLKRMI